MTDPELSAVSRQTPPAGAALMAASASAHGIARVALLLREDESVCAHEVAAARAAVAHIAARLGLRCEVVAGPVPDAAQCWWVPLTTLLAREWSALGGGGDARIWGGVVPCPHVATKLVSHPLWRPDAAAPPGWRRLQDIEDCTLPGWSVFSRDDALAAGQALLAQGALRVKCPYARGGNGQATIESTAALSRWLDAADTSLFEQGLVIERELVDAVTYSVGSSRLPGQAIAYHGEQRAVAGRDGNLVYGGSRLSVMSGGLAELRAAMAPGEVCDAVAAAGRYDRIVCEGYGVLATRRNYDVIAGFDGAGRRRLGVLEQSWRIGGASMAEVLAAERLALHPGPGWVVAETVESYDDLPPPADAIVYWAGGDGTPCKYARIVRDGR